MRGCKHLQVNDEIQKYVNVSKKTLLSESSEYLVGQNIDNSIKGSWGIQKKDAEEVQQKKEYQGQGTV